MLLPFGSPSSCLGCHPLLPTPHLTESCLDGRPQCLGGNPERLHPVCLERWRTSADVGLSTHPVLAHNIHRLQVPFVVAWVYLVFSHHYQPWHALST